MSQSGVSTRVKCVPSMRRACSCIQPGISTVAAGFDNGFPFGSGMRRRQLLQASVVVAREAFGLRNALIVNRGLDDGSIPELIDGRAMNRSPSLPSSVHNVVNMSTNLIRVRDLFVKTAGASASTKQSLTIAEFRLLCGHNVHIMNKAILGWSRVRIRRLHQVCRMPDGGCSDACGRNIQGVAV